MGTFHVAQRCKADDEQADRSGKKLLVIPPIAQQMDAWIKKGHSKDDWTILSQEA